MEAYVHGVSTRKVDDLVGVVGLEAGISKSEVSGSVASSTTNSTRSGPVRCPMSSSRMCSATPPISKAESVAGSSHEQSWSRPASPRPATGKSSASMSATPKTERFGPRSSGLRARGLGGVQLVISDHHLGLKEAIGAVFARLRVATLPRAFHAQRVGESPQRPRARWSQPRSARSSPNPTRPTSVHSSTKSPACSPASSPTSRRCSPTPLKTSSRSRVPRRALAQDLVHEPPRTRQRRDQTPHERRGDLPQRRVRRPPRHRSRVETHDEWAVAERRYLSEESMAKLHETRPRTPDGGAPRDQRMTH